MTGASGTGGLLGTAVGLIGVGLALGILREALSGKDIFGDLKANGKSKGSNSANRWWA